MSPEWKNYADKGKFMEIWDEYQTYPEAIF